MNARNSSLAPEAENSELGRCYRFEHLTLPLVLRDMRFNRDDPAPGEQVPDFDLPTLRGSRFKSADLGESGPALLVFGSYTCPVTDSAAPGLNELYSKFGGQVRFVMVNVREAHPGKAVPQSRAKSHFHRSPRHTIDENMSEIVQRTEW